MTIRKIFMVHHTHMDIGYTDQAREVLDQQLGFLDKAVELCWKHDDFQWTIESAYLVKDYLRNRPPEAAEALFDCLRRGRMELMAFEMQPLTELFDAAGLYDSVRYAAELGRKNGFPVRCAMLDDIGGFAGALPSALNASQVRYLTAGVGAFQVFLPWADLPHLFYLRDRAGAQTLVWNLGVDRRKTPQQMKNLLAVYGLGANFIILPYLEHFRAGSDRKVEVEGVSCAPAVTPREKYCEFEARLEAENYPYEEVMLQYGGDNRWPSDFLPELLRKINASGELPPIELTTPSCFFEFMEQKYGERIPVREGVIADPWNIRANPSPEPLKIFRRAQRNARYAKQLAARTGSESVHHLLEETGEQLDLYVDHTCGLSSWHIPELTDPAVPPDDPVFEPLRQSWQTKRSYAIRADALAARALGELQNRLAVEAAGPAVLVFNHDAKPQSGPVEFTLGRDMAGIAELYTPGGEAVKFEQIGHNHYRAAVHGVPANGMLALKAATPPPPPYFVKQPEKLEPLPEKLETGYFRVEFDTTTGAIENLSSRDGGIHYGGAGGLFEPLLQHPVNYALGWEGAGMMPPREFDYPSPVYHSAGLRSRGEVSTAIERRGRFPNGTDFRLILIFYRDFPRIDVRFYLNKPAHRRLESVYLGVPLQGETRKWTLSQNIGTVDPDRDLLPGAMRDAFYIADAARVETARYTAVMHSPDAPILHPGSPQLFQWHTQRDFTQEPPAFFWQIHHNMLITDCPGWQDIHTEFGFSLYLFPGEGIEGEVPPADSLRTVWHQGLH